MRSISMLPKLLGGFLVVAVVAVMVSIFGQTGISRLIGLLDGMGKHVLVGSTSVLSLEVAMVQVQSAENALLARGIKDQDRAAAYAQFYAAQQAADNARKSYESVRKTNEEAVLWALFTSAWDDWWKGHTSFLDLEKSYRETSSEAVYSQMMATLSGNTQFDTALQALANSATLLNAYAAQTIQTGDDVSAQVRLVTEVGLLAGPVLAILLSVFLSLSITRPLLQGIAFAQTVAGGDFSQKLSVNRRDEVGQLASALNLMVEKLRGLVGTIQASAERVASSSEELNETATLLAEGAQSQALALDETRASLEDISAAVEQVSGNALAQAAAMRQGSASMAGFRRSIEEASLGLNEISSLAGQSVQKAKEGAEAVRHVVDGMSSISDGSEKIWGIVAVIADIADQTHLLALNASIEAARAGEHGRGFAVVANEVGKLAGRSAQSTREIEGLIKDSAKGVAHGVETAEESHKAMEHIGVSSAEVRQRLAGLSTAMTRQVDAVKELSRALENVSGMSQKISVAAEQQTANTKQVTRAMASVSEVTLAAASSAERMSRATEQLFAMAQDLHGMLGQFRIGSDDDVPILEGAAPGTGHDEGEPVLPSS